MEAGGKVQLTHAPPLRICADPRVANLNRSVFRSRKPNRNRLGLGAAPPARRPPPPEGASPETPRARRAVAPALRRSARRCFTQGGRGGSFILDLYPILMYPDFKLSGVPLACALPLGCARPAGRPTGPRITRVQPTRAQHEERGGPAPRARSLLYAIRIIDFQVR